MPISIQDFKGESSSYDLLNYPAFQLLNNRAKIITKRMQQITSSKNFEVPLNIESTIKGQSFVDGGSVKDGRSRHRESR